MSKYVFNLISSPEFWRLPSEPRMLSSKIRISSNAWTFACWTFSPEISVGMSSRLTTKFRLIFLLFRCCSCRGHTSIFIKAMRLPEIFDISGKSKVENFRRSKIVQKCSLLSTVENFSKLTVYVENNRRFSKLLTHSVKNGPNWSQMTQIMVENQKN